MLTHTHSPNRQWWAGSNRVLSGQWGPGAIHAKRGPFPQGNGTSQNEGCAKEQWEERRLALVTLPADFRYLTGRY
jgi:hypothetical protein